MRPPNLNRRPGRPPVSAAIACAIEKSHAPLRGEEKHYASNCRHCSVPIERDTRAQRDYWLAFAFTQFIFEEPDWQ